MKEKLLNMGHSERPHGIKGGFSFELYNHEDSFLLDLPEVWLFPRAHPHKISKLPIEGKKFKLKDITLGHKVILYLENINSMTEAEAILPFDLKVDESLLPEADADEIYLKDLIGLKAVSKDDMLLGEIHAAYENGAQLVIVVKKESGELVDVPYVDTFIHEVNMEKGEIILTLPDWNFS